MIAIVAIVFGIALRLNALEADPDIRVDGDLGLFTDEGLYSLSARNLALFDEFNPNPENQVVEAIDYPVYTFAQFASFKIAGVTLKALRYPSVFFSGLILILFFALAKRYCGEAPALVGLILLSFSYMFIQYNRLGLLENLISLFVLASIFCVLYGQDRRWHWLLISGAFFGLAAITKGTALFLLPGMLLAVGIGRLEKDWVKKGLKCVGLFLVGLGLVFIIREIYMHLITSSDLLKIMVHSDLRYYAPPFTLIERAVQLFSFSSPGGWFKSATQIVASRFSLSNPIVFFMAFFYSVWFLATIRRPLDDGKNVQLSLMLIVVTAVVGMSFFAYQPNRYRVPLIPLVCLLASLGFSELLRKRKGHEELNRLFPYLVGFGTAVIIFRSIRVGMVAVGLSPNNDLLLIITLVISGWVAFVFRRSRSVKLYYGKPLKAISIALILVALAHNLFQYGSWIRKATYNARAGNAAVKGLIQSGVIGGQYAPILGLESQNVLIPLSYKNIEHFKNLNLTHYLDAVHHWPHDDFDLLNHHHPDFLSGAKLLVKLPIGFSIASLYQCEKKAND